MTETSAAVKFSFDMVHTPSTHQLETWLYFVQQNSHLFFNSTCCYNVSRTIAPVTSLTHPTTLFFTILHPLTFSSYLQQPHYPSSTHSLIPNLQQPVIQHVLANTLTLIKKARPPLLRRLYVLERALPCFLRLLTSRLLVIQPSNPL
jgi:hypothetical protein